MGEYRVAPVDQLSEPGSRVIVDIEGVEVAVFNLEGEFKAIANYCIHEGGPLCKGRISGDVRPSEDDDWLWVYDEEPSIIRCPWHNWKFDIETGNNISDERYQVPTYEVKVREGEIYVSIP